MAVVALSSCTTVQDRHLTEEDVIRIVDHAVYERKHWSHVSQGSEHQSDGTWHVTAHKTDGSTDHIIYDEKTPPIFFIVAKSGKITTIEEAPSGVYPYWTKQ